MRLLIFKNERRADDQLISIETGNNDNFLFLLSYFLFFLALSPNKGVN